MQNHPRLADLDRLPHCTNDAHAVVILHVNATCRIVQSASVLSFVWQIWSEQMNAATAWRLASCLVTYRDSRLLRLLPLIRLYLGISVDMLSASQ